jgi:uncharacterized protein (DUF2141 family)
MLAVGGSAQIGSISATNAEARYTLSGTVVNSATGEPVRRALVQVFLGAEQAALTDSSGHFEFSGLPPGQTSVTVRKPGFFTEQDVNSVQGAPAMAQVGPNATPVVVKLTPEGAITGRIESRDGEGIDNLPVRVIYFHIMNGHRQWEQLGNTNTNDDGEFRVGKLMPGLYYVVAGPGSESIFLGRAGSKGREAVFPEVFYPGVRDLNSATPIQLAPGQQLEADFSISPEPVFHVSGTVPTVGDEQGVGIEFSTESGTSLPVPTEYGPEGTFKSRLPAGSYVLKATAFGQGPPMTGSVNLTVNSDLTDVRIPLAAVHSIPVRTTVETTRTSRPRNAAVNVVTIHLSRMGAAFGNSDEWISLGGSPDPAANSIHDLPPGRYAIEITSSNPEWYVRSAQCGGTDLLHDDLTVAPGTRMPEIQVVLRDDGAGLTGTTMAGGSPSRAAVIAIPDTAPRMAKLALAGPDGRFTFDRLAPGDYTVIAVDHAEGLEYSNPDALGPYVSAAVHVSLPPNGQATVDINVVGVGKS